MVNTATNQEREMRVAVERVVGFAQEFGEAHLNLACHAAFPLSLTPDLLYQIWANFVPEAPWTAVARVLLSRLCKQVGSEMYEMDNSVRNLLLRELKVQFGQERFESLGEFLLEYVGQRLTEEDPDTQDLCQAQEWTALAYTKPEQAARELAEVLSDKVQQEDIGEVLRLSSLVETLSEPLVEAGFEPLLVYSRGMRSYVCGDVELARKRLEKIFLEEEPQIIAGIKLYLPKILSIKAELPLVEASQYISIDDSYEEDHPYFLEMAEKMIEICQEDNHNKSLSLNVLELGAGTGVFTIKLANSMLDELRVIDAVELDWHCFNILQQKTREFTSLHPGIQINVFHADVRIFNPPEEFDYIFSCFSDQYIKKEDKLIYLENIKQNLKPGGLMIIGDEFLPEYDLDNAESKVKALRDYHNHIIKISISEGKNTFAQLEHQALLSGLNGTGVFKLSCSQYEKLLSKAGFSFKKTNINPLKKDDVGGVYVYALKLSTSLW